MNRFFIVLLLFIAPFILHAQKQDLRLNLEKGETYYKSYIGNREIRQTFSDSSITAEQYNGSVRNEYKINAKNEYGYYAEFKVEAVNLTSSTSYLDPKKETSENKFLRRVCDSTKNLTTQIFLTKQDKIENPENIKSGLYHLYRQKLSTGQRTINTVTPLFFDHITLIERVTFPRPDEPVEPGGQWEQNSKIKLGIKLNVDAVYTYEGTTDNTYAITGKADVTSDKEPVEYEGYGKIVNDLHGSLTFEMEYDKKTGWIKKGKIIFDAKGEIKPVGYENIPEGSVIPVTMTEEYYLGGGKVEGKGD